MASGVSSNFRTTANDRFKQGYSRSTSIGITAAVAIHFVLFQFSPQLNAADIPLLEPPTVVVLPPAIAVPPPPAEISRPATPRVTDNISEDITIPPTVWDSVKPELPGPPPVDTEPRGPIRIPREVEPRLTNADEMADLLRRLYPSTLREAGIGGTVVLDMFVDDGGIPSRARVRTSSGYGALDSAALDVSARMRFVPAQNRDKPVGVWVRQAISFTVD